MGDAEQGEPKTDHNRNDADLNDQSTKIPRQQVAERSKIRDMASCRESGVSLSTKSLKRAGSHQKERHKEH